MAATVISAELVQIDDPLNFTERAGIAGFLAAYTGNTLVTCLIAHDSDTLSAPIQPRKGSDDVTVR